VDLCAIDVELRGLHGLVSMTEIFVEACFVVLEVIVKVALWSCVLLGAMRMTQAAATCRWWHPWKMYTVSRKIVHETHDNNFVKIYTLDLLSIERLFFTHFAENIGAFISVG